ncbi:MAG TPA: type II secretion system F family protein [Xanthobacteraceae bacterium]|nr:type II secretion system F family protein [Xanthobacteraceae bacterium]
MNAADLIANMLGDSDSMMLTVLVFLAAATLAFCVMAAMQIRGSVKRRAAGLSSTIEYVDRPRSLRYSSFKLAQRLLEHATKHYASSNQDDTKVLRSRLIKAGIFDPRAVGYFFVGRTALAIALAAGMFFFAPVSENSGAIWFLVIVGGIVGYVGPSMYIDRRIKSRKMEHQAGFPDFMDLLVVCADSGLSMEASLDRVGRELGDSYPSLTANIHMANLEIRAGRTMSDALDHLSERLGLEEARSFATLIQQSEELGSSITDALRVYSDDMRHKRLSRAEEKAYSLPAKLSLPMMICIFPVIFVVIMLPVFVRLHLGMY